MEMRRFDGRDDRIAPRLPLDSPENRAQPVLAIEGRDTRPGGHGAGQIHLGCAEFQPRGDGRGRADRLTDALGLCPGNNSHRGRQRQTESDHESVKS